MHCERCATELERPGDFCLTCRTGRVDAIVLEVETERATISMIDDGEVLGSTTITTIIETAERLREIQQRNYTEQIAAEIRRKRPESVYATGDRNLLRRLRGAIGFELYRIEGDDPVATYLEGHAESPLEIVDGSAASKLGGSHTTLIGDRRGRAIVDLVAGHPHVKKIIPGPIDSGGSGSRTGFRAKVTRTDPRGNLRLLFREGSSVQTVRVITTAGDQSAGRRIGEQLDDRLREKADHR